VFIFAFSSSMLVGMESGVHHPFVIECKGCHGRIPAPVETLPASWIAMQCPLCGVYRAYLPDEIFQGDVSMELRRKPVQSARWW
jgi:hypothetical protein